MSSYIPRENRIILLHRATKLRPKGVVGGTASEDDKKKSKRLLQPPYKADFSTFGKLTFALYVHAVDGSPTAWSLKPRLRLAATSVHGYQDSNWATKELTPTEAAKLTEGGEWFPDLDQNTPLPYLGFVTIKTPLIGMAIDFGEVNTSLLSFTGGTDPAIQAALDLYPKGS